MAAQRSNVAPDKKKEEESQGQLDKYSVRAVLHCKKKRGKATFRRRRCASLKLTAGGKGAMGLLGP